jgi:hypothetical protein
MAPYSVPLQSHANVLFPEKVKTWLLDHVLSKCQLHFGRLHVYLQVDKFHPHRGIPSSPWDDKLYAQKGELYLNQAVLVECKGDYIHQPNQQVLVPMPDIIDATLAGDPTLELLGKTLHLQSNLSFHGK